ncbi:aldehyde dehydrogenase family protein, partial [Vibrio parahaemolyticus EKP-028]
LYCDIALLA